MCKRLSEFLEINNVIHSLQFGFRRKHSTAHALISLTERIKQTIDDRNYLSKLLYHGIFHPFISYGIRVWGLTYKSYLDPVFVLQKKTLKAITFSGIRSPNTPIFCDLDLLKLCDICNLQVASFVFECVNGLSPSYFHEYFKLISSQHTIRTRQSTIGNLFSERRNTDQYGRRSVQFYGVILWNSIPPEIRNLKSTACFRTKLKKHYISFSMLCEIL